MTDVQLPLSFEKKEEVPYLSGVAIASKRVPCTVEWRMFDTVGNVENNYFSGMIQTTSKNKSININPRKQQLKNHGTEQTYYYFGLTQTSHQDIVFCYFEICNAKPLSMHNPIITRWYVAKKKRSGFFKLRA